MNKSILIVEALGNISDELLKEDIDENCFTYKEKNKTNKIYRSIFVIISTAVILCGIIAICKKADFKILSNNSNINYVENESDRLNQNDKIHKDSTLYILGKNLYEIPDAVDEDNLMSSKMHFLVGKDYKNMDVLKEDADLIIIGELDSVEGCTNYNEKAQCYMIISTLGNLKVNTVIKGEAEEGDIIPYIQDGGIINYYEYEKGIPEGRKQKDGYAFANYTDEEKKEMYVEEYPNGSIKLEKGKKYLLFLKYNDEFERYAIRGFQFGVREFNENENTFKNNLTGEFEKIDLDMLK